MDDLLSLSDIPDKNDTQAFENWLEERSLDLALIIELEIQRIVTNALEAFVLTVEETTVNEVVVASGDLYSIDGIIPEWNLAVQNKIVPHTTQTHMAGSVSAYATAGSKADIPNSVLNKWVPVVNQQAVSYSRVAENRLRNVGNTLWNDIRKKVTKSIKAGNKTENLKREIQNIGRFSEYRADTIARTETSSAYINGNYAGEQALGQYGPVEKVWVASLDARTRQSHVAVWQSSLRSPIPFAQPFAVGNTSMMYPHSPGAPAGEVVNCRCYYDSYYVGDRRPNGTIVTSQGVGAPVSQMRQPMQPAMFDEPIDYQYKTVDKELLPWVDRDTDWRASLDPTKRATGMWQFEYSPQRAIRQMINNRQSGLPEMTRVEALSDVSVARIGKFVNKGEEIIALTKDDLMNEARLASRVIQDQLETQLEPTSKTLYRGMRMEFEESKTWFANLGDEIDLPLSSWTEKSSEASLYANPTLEMRRSIFIELQEGADTLPLYRNASGRMSESREHLSPATRYRIVKKEMKKNEIRIVLAAV